MASVGPLLQSAINEMNQTAGERSGMVAASVGGDMSTGALPVYVQVPKIELTAGLSWPEYKERVTRVLTPIQERIQATMNVDTDLLFAGNAIRLQANPDQCLNLASYAELEIVELDPLVDATLMDDAVIDVDLAAYQASHSLSDGSGVIVAVLDSGIDERHPALSVAKSISTCGESVDIPGSHGTHCAGSIASSDPVYQGIAPGVTLINVKVLRSNGSGQSSFITQGVDAALDEDADILSMSLGFNHLPRWSDRGHGWTCPDGSCPMCTAVDNAVNLDNKVCVVAAGNEHIRSKILRENGFGNEFDTELGCPGQARQAITVGAIQKRTFEPAPFSSRGPTAYGDAKPDLVAPGVNITSTVPVPRDAMGVPDPSPSRSDLFGRKSGTSMATPIVTGSIALLVQQYKTQGISWNPQLVMSDLLTRGVVAVPSLPNTTGGGRLVLTGL